MTESCSKVFKNFNSVKVIKNKSKKIELLVGVCNKTSIP